MKRFMIFIIAASFALGGCSSIKKLTGQRDDSVLPGQRENVLPPERQVAQDPAVVGSRAPQSTEPSAPASPQKCKLNDINCEPSEDIVQEPIESEPQ
jgi:hypothetical protein